MKNKKPADIVVAALFRVQIPAINKHLTNFNKYVAKLKMEE
jgi:hypothetical protein